MGAPKATGNILRSEVYQQIQSGEAFDMIFCTADRRRKTGGVPITCDGWMLCTSEGRGVKSQAAAPTDVPEEKERKDPHHEAHGTVNVFNPANPGYHPISVHLDLIMFFNGKRVIN